jgi:uncharacterized OsmC-like protein
MAGATDGEIQRIGDAVRGARDYLTAHPDEAAYTDTPATARLESGLRVSVQGPDGATVVTDMPASVGGGGSAPSAGWLMRAAHAACVATLVAMRAADEGLRLSHLEVTVDSDSDDRGILGAVEEDEVPPGPIRTRVRISLAADGATEEALHVIAGWAWRHCPVDDAVRRTVPVTVEVDVAGREFASR